MRKTITRIVMAMCLMALSLPIAAQTVPEYEYEPSNYDPNYAANTILEPKLSVGDTIIRDNIVYVVEKQVLRTTKKNGIDDDKKPLLPVEKGIKRTSLKYVTYDVTYKYELSVSGPRDKTYSQKLSSFNLADSIDLTHKAVLAQGYDLLLRSAEHGVNYANQNTYHVIGKVRYIADNAFTGVYNGYSYASPFNDGITISIPSFIVSIGKEAFSCNPSIKSVVFNMGGIKGGINIGGNNSAFNLGYATGKSAFANCVNLETVTFNGSVDLISESCFANDIKLKNVLINFANLKMLTEIGNGAFAGDTQFEGFMYKTSYKFYADPINGFSPYITTIGDGAFSGCTSMTDVVFNTDNSSSLARGIGSIGAKAFSGTSLRVCKLPNTLSSLDMRAFDNTLVKHVAMPSYVTQLTTGTTGEPSITEVTVPDGATVSDLNGAMTLYCLSTTTDGLPTVSSSGAPIYVKPSVYAKLSSNPYNRFRKDIPITMPNTCDEDGHAYVSLCRDFDCDFTGSGLKAYAMTGLRDDGYIITTTPLDYAPSRFNALSSRDKFEKYAGIIVEGEPGKTYYYHIGEQDYTTGDSRKTEDAAFGKSSDQLWGKGSVDGEYVTPTNDDGSVNYGLSRSKYRLYSVAGWVPYNRTYLNVPASSLGAKVSMLSISFDSGDGEATSIKLTDFDNLLQGDATYDLQGRKVGKDYKGIVIRNGKKTLQK